MKDKLLRFSFFLFLIFIPFGTKKFIFSFGAPVSELNSIFLYASDILLFVFIFLFFPAGKIYFNTFKNIRIIFLWIFLALAFVSIFFAFYKAVAVYNFLRLVLLVFGALAIAGSLSRGIIAFEKIMIVLGSTALFQALVGFLQFKFQRSIGLGFLGEPAGNVFTRGLGTVAVQNGILLRSFGTMSHANIFAAFLVMGLAAFYYLYLCSNSGAYVRKIFISAAILFTAVGLVFAFSRSGWITAGAVTVFMLTWGLANREHRRTAFNLFVILVTCFLLLVSAFGWLIFPRAHLSMRDSSISDRYVFNLIGLDILKSRPFGVGIGNQFQYSIDNHAYEKFGLFKKSSWQPIHNIYLLIASETGILGLLAFLLFIAGFVLKRNFFSDLPGVVAITLLLFVLVFGLFDHFFWDLQSGRLMFWLVLGILMSISSGWAIRTAFSPRSVTG